MAHRARRRFLVAYVVALAVAAVGSTLAIREILVMRHDDEVSGLLEQQVREFEALIETGLNPETGRPYSSAHELLIVFLERQVPTDEAMLTYAEGSFLRGKSRRLPLTLVPPRQTQAFASLSTRFPRRGELEGTFETRVGEATYLARHVVVGDTTGALVVAAVPGDGLIEIREDVERWGVPALLGILLVASIIGLAVARLVGRTVSIGRCARSTRRSTRRQRLAERSRFAAGSRGNPTVKIAGRE